MPASATIKGFEVTDVRFPTSDLGDGSDAMHTDPDYSAAYVVLNTDVPGLEGHGLAFTLGRGTEIVVQAVRALEPLAVGRCLDEIRSDWAGFWRTLTSEPQLRWVGPEKGVIHLATAAVVAKRDIPQTVLAHALKMLSTQIGLGMGTVTTVHMYLQIMATADQQVLQSG